MMVSPLFKFTAGDKPQKKRYTTVVKIIWVLVSFSIIP